MLLIKRQTSFHFIRAPLFWARRVNPGSPLCIVRPAQDNELFPVPDTYGIEGIPPIKKSDVENLFYDTFSH